MGNKQIYKLQTLETTIATIPHNWTFSSLQQSISIMSYNVLADCYCDQSYYKYAQSITIDDRASRVIKTILHLNPDIIAFQEVDHFDDIYNGSLESQYELRFYQRPTRQDGLLMGWKKDRYELIEESLMDYDELAKKSGKGEEYMRHNIAQLITLRQIETGKEFQVANTHLFWNPRNENVKFQQMIQLMSFIAEQEQRQPLMICGDFNSLPHSNVVQFILNKSEPSEQRTQYSNKKIVDEMIQDYNDVSQNLEQFRQLCSAYYLNNKHPRYTTYVPKFIGNIDYIFYDKEFLRVSRLLDIPNEQTVTQEQFLPNSIFPSDHLPLMVEFIFQ